jgi:Putative binding domain, N-terminal
MRLATRIWYSLRASRITEWARHLSPIFDYTHANGRCSVTGGYVYRGSRATLPSGTYLYGDYCSGEIFGWNGATQSVLLDTAANISSFGEDEAQELYVVDLGGSVSRIVRSCEVVISPTSAAYGPAAATDTISVAAGADCDWMAESNAPWITVTDGANGSGDGTMTYSVAPYTGRPKSRTGTITVAGRTFSIKQSK